MMKISERTNVASSALNVELTFQAQKYMEILMRLVMYDGIKNSYDLVNVIIC